MVVNLNIKIDKDLRDKAKAKAKKENLDLSKLIRRFLLEYVKESNNNG